MEDHLWEIITAECETLHGEDCFPTEAQREFACVFILQLPECPVIWKVELPQGAKLIFFRRNKMDVHEEEIIRSHTYIIGYNLDGKKSVQEITELDPGIYKSELRDNDQRDD